MPVGANLLVGVALLIAGCSRPGSAGGSSALKPVDQAALQTMVERTGKELLIPGGMVLLRTPQGEFTVSYGTTLLGATIPPRGDTHFRIASNTKTMTAAGAREQAWAQRSGVQVHPGCTQQRRDHHRPPAGNAQRSLRLH